MRASLALATCATGDVVITSVVRLRVRHVIHAVGPVWRGGGAGEDGLLASCYRSALALAEAHGARSIAFPAISTGAYGFPLERATRIAVGEALAAIGRRTPVERIVFCCFSSGDAEVYARVLEERAGPVDG